MYSRKWDRDQRRPTCSESIINYASTAGAAAGTISAVVLFGATAATSGVTDSGSAAAATGSARGARLKRFEARSFCCERVLPTPFCNANEGGC